jgi:hypothetical protein
MADKEPFSSLTGIEQDVQIAFGRRGENQTEFMSQQMDSFNEQTKAMVKAAQNATKRST